MSGLLDAGLRLAMLGLSLVSGPLQFVRHLLGLLIGTLAGIAFTVHFLAAEAVPISRNLR